MLEQYHDKYPVGQTLQDMKNNQAAFDMLVQKKEPDPKNEKPRKEPKPMTIMVLLICCFVALYIVCMGLATDLVKRDYEETFKRNIDDVIRFISENFDEERTDSLNDIYDISATKDEYQFISAAVYDSEDELIAITESYLCLETEDETYYFVLEDYFSESDLATLLYYVRDTSDKYTVEAHLDKETKALASLQFNKRSLSGETSTVWEWQNPGMKDSEDMIVYRKKTPIKDIFSVPYYRIEDDELWIDDTVKGEEYKDTFSYETASGEKQDYVISVQSAEHSMKAAMNLLMPVYVVGFVVMLIGISVVVYGRIHERVHG